MREPLVAGRYRRAHRFARRTEPDVSAPQPCGNRLPSFANVCSAAGMRPCTAGPDGATGRSPSTTSPRVTGVAASTVSRALDQPGRVNAATRRADRGRRPRAELRAQHPGAGADAPAGPAPIARAGLRHHQPVLLRHHPRHPACSSRPPATPSCSIDTEDSGELETELLHKMRRSLDGAILAASRLTDRAWPRSPQRSRWSPSTATSAACRASSSTPRPASARPSSTSSRWATATSPTCPGPRRPGPTRPAGTRMRGRADRHGLDVRRVGPFPPGRRSGSAAADAVLNTGATACIAFNDLLAIGMLHPPARARRPGARRTSASSAATTSSAPTSATRR